MMFADAIAKASAGSPMLAAQQPAVPGRVLLVDGDAVCYACAGNDDTSAWQARINVHDRIRRAKQLSGSESVLVPVTGRASHKGHRYAVARAKPYQGQRSSSRRPKNWDYLRQLVEGNSLDYPCEFTNVAEADDLFSKHSFDRGWANVVIHTQDKDMRMVAGYHLTWDDFNLIAVPEGTWALEFGGKLYGEKWFWMQMLHGDTADNIPGLPRMTKPDGKQALCGEKTAAKLLEETTCRADALAIVTSQYKSYYGDAWASELLEQGVLLWMRRRPGDVFDVCAEGGPLFGISDEAKQPLLQRIAEAQACQPG